MITYRIYVISLLVVAGLAAATTRYYFPQIQSKTLTVDHVVEHNNIVTVTHVVKEPNGVVDTTTTVTDHSTRVDQDIHSEVTAKQLDWQVGGIIGSSIHTLQPIYGAEITRRIIGPVYVRGFGLTDGVFGVSIGLSF